MRDLALIVILACVVMGGLTVLTLGVMDAIAVAACEERP